MNTRTIAVFDPTGQSRTKEIAIAPKVQSLNDRVIGLLWNSKPNGDFLLLRVKELLSQKFHTADALWRQKPGAGIPVEPSVLEELVNGSVLVITATGD